MPVAAHELISIQCAPTHHDGLGGSLGAWKMPIWCVGGIGDARIAMDQRLRRDRAEKSAQG